jgi:anion-transporting  ArsA/GET3 family ATPase
VKSAWSQDHGQGTPVDVHVPPDALRVLGGERANEPAPLDPQAAEPAHATTLDSARVSVAEILDGKSVCVCGGSGGVGKTTTSAAIALGMAARGAKVAVVTIDPARRLANALGLDELDNEPRLVDPGRLSRGLSVEGELWAMMLDPKRTFDELIERVAPDPQRAEEIKSNRVYRELSMAVSGSQEFTAVAKLYELARDGDYDLLVLDTPPSRNALDFLDAPGRLTSFLDGRGLRTFVRPTGLGMRVLGRGAAPLLGALRRVTGVDLLGDLATFFGLLGDMTKDFSERATQVQQLLHAPQTAFVLVTSAQPAAIEEALWFRRTLDESGLPFAGVIVNRVHHDLLGDSEPDDLVAALGDQLPDSLARRVADNFADYHVLARRDGAGVRWLAGELGGRPLLQVPQFDDDVHDIDGLLKVHRYLFASDAERERMIAGVVA